MRRAAATTTRPGLSRERVLRAATAIADEHGIGAVSMRSVASAVGVEAMSLYHHVESKQALLDGLVALVVEECRDEVAARGVPDAGTDWHAAVRTRVLAARAVMLRHPWAPAVVESRTCLLPAVARWLDDVVGDLRAGGFHPALAHDGLHALGTRCLGFARDLLRPGAEAEPDGAATAAVAPTLLAVLTDVGADDLAGERGGCDADAEFAFGLDLLLDGLASRLPG